MVNFSITIVDPEKFVLKFNWDDSKYPRNQQLSDLLKIITQVGFTDLAYQHGGQQPQEQTSGLPGHEERLGQHRQERRVG